MVFWLLVLTQLDVDFFSADLKKILEEFKQYLYKYFNYRQEISYVTSSCRIRILFYIYHLNYSIYSIFCSFHSLIIHSHPFTPEVFFLSKPPTTFMAFWWHIVSVSEKLFTLFWMQSSLDKMFDLIFIIIIFLCKLWVIWKCTFYHSFIECVFN